VKQPLLFAAAAAAVLVTGCATTSPVGLVDVNRIVSHWTVYQQFQQQLLIDEQTIAQSRATQATKQQEALALQRKYARITSELTKQIRDAASKVAAQKNMTLVVTKEGVGYGGTDITPDVEKAMNISDKSTPTPD
jgi:Skp family chaperone for outer membrane proteins